MSTLFRLSSKVLKHGLPSLPPFAPPRLIHQQSSLKAAASASATASASLLTTIRAAVLHKAKTPLVIEQLRMPQPRNTEVLVKVRACGVCHSDLHCIHGNSALPHPLVLGHEVSGEVVAYGPEVDTRTKTRLPLGQKVVSSFIMPCGSCPHCVTGKEEICNTFFEFSRAKGVLYDGETRLYRQDNTPVHVFSMGGLAEYSVIPSNAVFALPQSLESRHTDAAVLGCAVFTAYGAVKHAGDIRPGHTVAVFGGAGGVGSQVIQLAQAFGAETIIAIDINDDKLAATRKLGATHVVNAKTAGDQLVQRVRDITGGKGVQVAFELLGRPQTFRASVDSGTPASMLSECV